MRFEFSTANRIIFGPDALREVGPLAAAMGRRAFVVAGRNVARAEPLLELLKEQRLESFPFSVAKEPTTEIVLAGVKQAREARCDLVIAIGGGSVLDTGKAVAAMLTNPGELMDYLEVVGRAQPLTEPAAPCIAIPTTAGTGAEVTRNSVLESPQHRVKVSVRSRLMLPTLAVVDPVLTYSMPPDLTAQTGLDALTQLMETFVAPQANPLTDGICREGLRRAGACLRCAYEDGDDRDAREGMSLASLFGGLALANAKLGAVHGFAGPLGGMYSAPHGAVCGRLLPYVMEANVRALQDRAPNAPALGRYVETARILTGKSTASAADGVAWVQDLCAALSVPPLSAFGLRREHFPDLIAKSRSASSMKGNPASLTDEELSEILAKAF
jgi:alcohol dehydrogenase class IV